jgi:hypothetical protein
LLTWYPNQHIIGAINAAFQKAMHEVQNRKPVLYILENLRSDFDLIYEKAEDRLLKLFEDHPYDEKLAYLLKIMMELRVLKHKAEMHHLTLDGYYLKLKKFLKIQHEYLINSQHQNPLNLHLQRTGKEKKESELVSFEYQGSIDWLVIVVIKLNKRFNFLSPRTSVESFVQILTSENLKEEKSKIYIGCRTNIFKSIIEYLEPFFLHLNYANVGRSGLFISKKGIPISVTNLNSATLKNQKIKHDLKNIFM